MARYINTYKGVDLPVHGKTQFLLANVPGATRISPVNIEYQPDLVCVIDNGIFQAAAYLNTPNEFEVFRDDRSGRPKDWLIVPGVAEFANK
jgi:hypothetical protein